MIYLNHPVEPSALLGRFRQFGAHGPVYQVTGVLKDDTIKGKMLKVRVVESGEELPYPYREALNDPEAS